MGGVGHVGERRGAYRNLVGRPLGRPRYIGDDNIQMDLQEMR
jgi:hypothetical protein